MQTNSDGIRSGADDFRRYAGCWQLQIILGTACVQSPYFQGLTQGLGSERFLSHRSSLSNSQLRYPDSATHTTAQ